MGCGNKDTKDHHTLVVNHINKCILECLILLNDYRLLKENRSFKNIISNIIMYKNHQLNILKNLYKLFTGDENKLNYKDTKSISPNIDNIIEKEFKYIDLITPLYNNVQNNIKESIFFILISENNIINKLLFINKKK